MPASSLTGMARRACIKNIRAITDVGDTPYEIVRPVLIKIENPAQLRQIEEASPQIVGLDAEIWREFIKRDVQDWEKKPHEPKNPHNWHKVYKKLVRENQNQVTKDAMLLKATIDGINEERSKHRMKRVELDFVKLPEDMKRSGPTISLNNKIRFTDRGTLHDKPPSQREIKIFRGELDPNAPRRAPPKPKSKLDHLKKDLGSVPRFQPNRKPTGIISAREMALKQKPTNTTITKAPRAMVEEYRQASAPKRIDPSVKPAAVFNPKKRKIEHEEDTLSMVNTTADREKRLKLFTDPSSMPRATPIIKPPRSQKPVVASPSPASSPPSKDTAQLLQKGSSSLSPPQTEVTPNNFPPKAVARGSPIPALGISRSNTSSPSNGGKKIMKRKAPADADIFMQPKKRSRAS